MSCPHFAQFIYSQAEKLGEKKAMWYRDEKAHWQGITWNESASKVKALTLALEELGVKPAQNIAIFTQNKPESFLSDFALYGLGAVVVPLFSGSTVDQLTYIINDASIPLIFVGEQYQYDTAHEAMKTSAHLKQIVVFADKVKTKGEKTTVYFSDLIKKGDYLLSKGEQLKTQPVLDIEETATIMYTSGTTGEPKGVMLSHKNFLEAVRIHDIVLNEVSPKDTSLAFLPISHIFERTWTYFCLHRGAEVYFNQDPQEVRKALKEVRPTMMCSVPRFWEKVYAGIIDKVEDFNPLMQGISAWAVAIGSRYNIDYLRLEKTPPFGLRLSYKLVDKLIFSKIKNEVGIENAHILPTAGAALSDDIHIFLRSIGIPIVYGYGLTETTATVSCFRPTQYKIGTVGTLMPDLEIKIGESHEICVKGGTIFKGYYNKPEVNAASFTADGYFRTGDAGYLERKEIILTERIKDLFKTSNGKYIAPQQIETALIGDKYIEQVAVIGDERNFVSAVIVPNLDELKKYAQRKNIDFSDIDSFLKHPHIIDFIMDRINEQQKGMAGFEHIKRFVLVKHPFSMETGELTNTLKLRRPFILHKYKKLIEKMYK